MAFSDFGDMLQDACGVIGTDRNNIVAQLTRLLALEAELDVLPSGERGKDQIQRAIATHRAIYKQHQTRWRQMLNTVFGYGGTQLTTPSRYTKAGLPTNLRRLLDDINADMVLNTESVLSKARSWGAEPADDDDGIIDRLTVDRNGITMEGGYSASVDVVVQSKPDDFRSIVRVQGREGTQDVFDLKGPTVAVDIEAVNGAGGRNLVNNPNLANANTSTDEAAVTSLSNWTLSDEVGTPTHLLDTDIAYRGNAFSHKLYGNSTTRRFRQPLIIQTRDRDNPRQYFLVVFKTGTPVGNITVTWGSEAQTFTMASLSAGFNYLRLDRNSSLFPVNFDTSGANLDIDFDFTSGSDASNYINFCYIGGQNLRPFNGAWYGHWSQDGISTLDVVKTLTATDSGAGLNQLAMFYAYEDRADRDFLYLRHVGAGNTIADYTP